MDKKILILACIFTAIIFFGGIFLVGGTTQTVQSSQVQIVAPQKDYDFGTIGINSGNVVATFIIKNAGTDVLQLTNIQTSCHCTKAYVTIDSAKSPYFGMGNFSSWVGKVNPGQTAILTVDFDPAFHGPNGVGQINRFISVETNDVRNPKLTFTLNGFVTK